MRKTLSAFDVSHRFVYQLISPLMNEAPLDKRSWKI